ncbi:MAG: hypothetical protein ACPGQS_03075 [Bradymonadia bacterium]
MTKMNPLYMLLPFSLTLGCAAALLGGSPKKVELTGLENVQKKITTYFDETTTVYKQADATLEAIAKAQTEFNLSAEDYRALTVSISTGTPFSAPKSLSTEQAANLSKLVTNGQLLTAAVKGASKKTSEASEFLVEQTSQIEKELLIVKRDHEVIKRNPLASRRDKGRAANQVRKANKLAKAINDDGQRQLKALSSIQANVTKTVGAWTLSLNPDLLKKAVEAQKSAIENEQLNAVNAKAKTLKETAKSQVDGTVKDGAAAGQKALDGVKPPSLGESEELKALNNKASATLKKGTAKGHQSINKLEKAAKSSLDEATDSLTEAPSEVEAADDDDSN